MENLLKKVNVVEHVLAEVQEVYGEELPGKGILAGGAVANSILSLSDGSRHAYPINDLDVFLHSRSRKKSGFLPFHHGLPDLEIEDYGGLQSIAKYGYRLVGTKRSGLLNEIHVNLILNDSVNGLSVVVEGFDINACQAGIDLETKQLYFSAGFDKFFRTRQLEAVNCCTPFQTTARLAQKQDDLGCYLDFATETSFLSTYAAHCDSRAIDSRAIGDGTRTYSPFFGKKHFAQCSRFEHLLRPYCTVVELDELPGTGEEAENIYRLAFNDDRLGELYDAVADFPAAYHMESFLDNPFVYRNVWNKLFRPTYRKVNRTRFMLAVKYPGTAPQAMARPGFVEQDFHLKHLTRVDKFVSTHPRLRWRLGETVREQYETIRVIEKAGEKYGHLHIGLMENPNLKEQCKITAEYIDDLVEKYKEEYYGNLCTPLNLKRFKYSSEVRELVTASDLIDCGARMRHCVGGYSSAVKSGRSRIFELVGEGNCSTLEIIQGRHGVIYLGQHYRAGNTEVSERESLIAEALLQFMLRKRWHVQMIGKAKLWAEKMRYRMYRQRSVWRRSRFARWEENYCRQRRVNKVILSSAKVILLIAKVIQWPSPLLQTRKPASPEMK